MNAWVLLLVLTGVPGQTPPAGGTGDQTAGTDGASTYSTTYTPVGIVTGEAKMGLVYAETGWPGPPAVCPPRFFARVCACLHHKPKGLPPPPEMSYQCPPPRPPQKQSEKQPEKAPEK
jgi:hypothetical protein